METLMEDNISGWTLEQSIAPCSCLTQGDLIRFEDEEDPLKKAGIVVTADCDLEKKKHANLVTLVPVVSVRTLMEKYLLPEDCEKKRSQIETYAFKEFTIDQKQETEVKIAILREKLEIASTDSSDPQIVAAKFATHQLDSISIREYKTLMEKIGISTKKTDSLDQQISSRGDLLPLPSPEKLGIEGSIAWVRHIWQVQINAIAIRTSELKDRPGERLARLNSPYRYRLTQILAQVFSDIGLPDTTNSFSQSIQEAYDNA
jgi:hypothetical protein